MLYCGQTSTKKDKIYSFFLVEMVDMCRNIKSFFPLCLYASDSSHSPSIRDVFVHITQTTRTEKTFCLCYTKYTRKLLSVSLQAIEKTTDVLTSQMDLNILN